MKKHNNLSGIIFALSKIYSPAQAGQLFSENLNAKRLDVIAYSDSEDEFKIKKMQSKIVSNLKTRLALATIIQYNFKNTDFKNLSIKNENSMLGYICSLAKNDDDELFEKVFGAVIKGSEEYLKKVPLAKYICVDQFKEYREIKHQLQKLL